MHNSQTKQETYDVVVVGGGHAGVEASHASARMGLRTLLITQLVDSIALASCNPAVGGLGKGHLVKEVDSLGGLMGIITDISGLQYRVLNGSKGPAVRGTRAQIDMDTYRAVARDLLLRTKNLHVKQMEVTRVLNDSGAAFGVETSVGKKFFAKKIIITSGTFLRGIVHIGEFTSNNGRMNEAASNALSQSLIEMGIPLERMKTGTCPRIMGSSINEAILEKHYGDAKQPGRCAPYFSLYTHEILNNSAFRESQEGDMRYTHMIHRIKDGVFSPHELPCFVTYTNERVHEMIESNFHRAPVFTGQIKGAGPRYCPSIEDKVNKFRDKNRHQLFLEPQTRGASEYYINGLSTSLPYEVQEEIIKSIEGIENAVITRYGYAIEYDYSQPTNLSHTLESKIIKNLFIAGQLNGTTGYEEAAAQGIVAGINAGLSILGSGEFTINRSDGYIGVMIDDLVSKGTNEPYRVFTSRSEHRLLLREDNACFRLLQHSKKIGILDMEIIENLERDQEDIKRSARVLNANFYPSKNNLSMLDSIGEPRVSNKCEMSLIIGRDSMDESKLRIVSPEFVHMSNRALKQIQIHAKYIKYIDKQRIQIERMEDVLKTGIPEWLSYREIPGLNLEAVEKLEKHRPSTLKEASMIPGITPANIEVLDLNISILSRRDRESMTRRA